MLVGNPIVDAELLAECRARGRLPSPLRMVLSGGGPAPASLRRAWRDEFAVPFVENFGQSEIGGFFALGYPELETDDSKLGRIGPPTPDKEVRIVSSSGAPVPPGTPGEIVLRGGFMAGYWGKPDRTDTAIRDGWLHSGDLGVIDGDGYLTMRGRRNELIQVAGVDWFPRDVEEALSAQPGVGMAALIGLPDARLGTSPVAFITATGALADREALKSAIRPLVPYDLTPLDIVVLDALPMTPTGKISKADLRAQVERRGA